MTDSLTKQIIEDPTHPTQLVNYYESSKEDLKIGFGRQNQHIYKLSVNISFSYNISKIHTKISLLACLLLEIAAKKTLKFGFGRQPPHNYNLIFLLVRLRSSCIPKISLLACLLREIATKKPLKYF